MEAEGPKMIRKNYATFPDGNLKWVEHWEPSTAERWAAQKVEQTADYLVATKAAPKAA